jgi:hypothetical protein
MRNRALLTAIATAASVAVAVAGAFAATRRTERVQWSPFTGENALRPTLRLAVAHDGDCWTGSFVVHRAYRCISGNQIRDPCFSDAASTSDDPTVLCVYSPFERIAVRLHVTGSMSRAHSAKPGGLPWALRLYSGRRCVFIQGATTVVRGGRANYFCGGNVILFGSPNRSRRLWRIWQGRGYAGAGGLRRVAIRSAYYGQG